MRCPFCHSEDTQVLDTRDSEEGDSVRRRRRCNACDKRFTTYERVELAILEKLMAQSLEKMTEQQKTDFFAEFGMAYAAGAGAAAAC